MSSAAAEDMGHSADINLLLAGLRCNFYPYKIAAFAGRGIIQLGNGGCAAGADSSQNRGLVVGLIRPLVGAQEDVIGEGDGLPDREGWRARGNLRLGRVHPGLVRGVGFPNVDPALGGRGRRGGWRGAGGGGLQHFLLGDDRVGQGAVGIVKERDGTGRLAGGVGSLLPDVWILALAGDGVERGLYGVQRVRGRGV